MKKQTRYKRKRVRGGAKQSLTKKKITFTLFVGDDGLYLHEPKVEKVGMLSMGDPKKGTKLTKGPDFEKQIETALTKLKSDYEVGDFDKVYSNPDAAASNGNTDDAAVKGENGEDENDATKNKSKLDILKNGASSIWERAKNLTMKNDKSSQDNIVSDANSNTQGEDDIIGSLVDKAISTLGIKVEEIEGKTFSGEYIDALNLVKTELEKYPKTDEIRIDLFTPPNSEQDIIKKLNNLITNVNSIKKTTFGKNIKINQTTISTILNENDSSKFTTALFNDPKEFPPK